MLRKSTKVRLVVQAWQQGGLRSDAMSEMGGVYAHAANACLLGKFEVNMENGGNQTEVAVGMKEYCSPPYRSGLEKGENLRI